jgi:rhodanese-related sulfurtransferase
MKTRSFSAAALAAVLLAGIPATAVWSADKAEVEKAIAAADEARKKAASAGGEWRDTGKFIKEAQKLAEEGKLDEALKLAEKAKRQGELGYEQAMNEKDADFPAYMKGGASEEVAATVSGAAATASEENKIAEDLVSVEVSHNGETVVVKRGHHKDATLPEEFAKTERGCPPFCVQPMVVAKGVDTIGELEMLEYLDKIGKGDESILVIDSRTPDWVMRGTIPGSVNIPWNTINADKDGTFTDTTRAEGMNEIMEKEFGVTTKNKRLDFSDAKTLVFFCNGIWCPQSSVNIKTLVRVGYPAEKIKWYRGGMQDWVSVGLTFVKP